MQRIVDGIAYEGKYSDSAYDVRVWEKNGHREISAQRVVEWTEIGPAPDWSHLAEPNPERDAEDAAERKAAALKRNASRAKTACRRFIKTMGFNEMATLTYRENQTDEALCKEHFRAWCRIMAQAVPGFGYCAGYETQDRGSWHVHAAIYKLPAKIARKVRKPDGSWREVNIDGWRFGTAIWRSIVGKDNGLCFIGGKGDRAKAARRSLAKMAAYVSKYILKHAESFPEGKQRYTHSKGEPVPKSMCERFCGVTLPELIGRCFWLESGERVVDHRIGRFKDSYYLCTELVGPDIGEVCS